MAATEPHVRRRRALLIATETYADPGLARLRAPAGDVEALAAVLEDSAVGEFEVRQVVDRPSEVVKREIEGFFQDARRDDLLLLYISGHGVLSQSGQLYFATAGTSLKFLRSTAIEDAFVDGVIQHSRARSVVIVLDCCHSGAFGRGQRPKSAPSVDVEHHLPSGDGRVTLTASTALEYAFEADEPHTDANPVGGTAASSVFTRCLVEGLRTGNADLDEDGAISVDELYDYVCVNVRERAPQQRPRMTGEKQGDILIAKSRRRPVLPRDFAAAVENPLPSVRAGVVSELDALLSAATPAMAAAVREALERLASDDSRRVCAAARAVLARRGLAGAPQEPPTLLLQPLTPDPPPPAPPPPDPPPPDPPPEPPAHRLAADEKRHRDAIEPRRLGPPGPLRRFAGGGRRRTAGLTVAAAAALATLAVVAVGGDSGAPAPVEGVRLAARAILPADHLEPGPSSGADLLEEIHGRPRLVDGPFSGQVVPGFSGLVKLARQEILGLPDNGFGFKDRSRDFLLRAYFLRPQFRTAAGGPGTITITGHIGFSDPDGLVRFELERDDRRLTGGDFDPEAIQRASDGSYWIAEEYGPYLLHASPEGELIDAPIPHPDVRSPNNPLLTQTATVKRTEGFEALAYRDDPERLYAVVQGPLATEDDKRVRRIFEFDVGGEAYTGRRFDYRVDAAFPVAAVTDMASLGGTRFAVLEIGDGEGADARQAKVYAIDLTDRDADGRLRKRLIADLLDIPDPGGVSTPPRPGEFGVGRTFSMPMQAPEAIADLGGGRLAIANDNNFPYQAGRWKDRDRPDDTELVVLRVPLAG